MLNAVKREIEQVLEYTPDDTYRAMIEYLSQSSAFKTKSADSTSRILYLSAGMTWKSFGEEVIVSISQTPNGQAQVQITSQPKVKTTQLDYGKNMENIQNLLTGTLGLLNSNPDLQKVIVGATAPQAVSDIPDQIKKLAELKDAGILTEDEFNSKKQELLSKL